MIIVFLLSVLGLALGAAPSFANPMDELTPDQKLYQRVKKLGDWGLLDPQDKAVLDEGKIVTRLELAFYTEKAKARITAPATMSAPQPIPSPITAPPVMAPPVMPSPTPAVVPSVPEMTAPMVPPPAANPAVRNEVDELLKELKAEAAYLKMRVTLNDERIKEQEKELNALQGVQNDVDAVFKKANDQLKSPSIDSVSRFRFEDIHLTGVGGQPSTLISTAFGPQINPGAIPSANAIRAVNEENIRLITDLGGKGSFSFGLGGSLSDSNASDSGLGGSGTASIYLFAPDFSFMLSGPLGSWNTHVMVQGYPGALTLGDFSRGVGPIFVKRFENPYEIKHYTDDKHLKIWNDYMTNIAAPSPSFANGVISSTYDQVFDGVFGVGNNLPLIGGDARLVLLFGRMGTTNTQTQRWEEGAKLDGSLLNNLRGAISTEWVNDNYANPQGPNLDLKTYQADLYLDLNPVNVSLEGAFSSFYTGFEGISPTNSSGTPTNTRLEAPAGQLTLSYYPFNLYAFAISDGFANFQSKVAMSSVNFTKYGVGSSPSSYMDVYGWIGEVDSLASDRYGLRANLGWNGRHQDWMKSWPSFLDAFVVNFDWSMKKEFSVAYDNQGYNDVEALNLITMYYPDDEGLWGLNFWGGYGAGGMGSPWYAVRQSYINNIQSLRLDNNTSFNNVQYKSNMSSEKIPIIIPADINGVPLPPGSAPATLASSPGTVLSYYVLPDLKTYNYITLTTKIQFNKLYGSNTPFYGSIFFTDNRVSGHSDDPAVASWLQNVPNLFEQTVWDFAGMYQLMKNVDLTCDYGLETWKSQYTYPLVDYRTDSLGGGFAYDFPWGGGKWEFRYKHLIFRDAFVPLNNYQADQAFSSMSFLF